MLSSKLKEESIKEMDIKEIVDKLRKLGEESLNKHLLGETLNVAENISPAENKSRVLGEIASNLYQSHLDELGKEVYKKIMNSVNDIEKKSDKAKTLADIGMTFFDFDKGLSENLFTRSLEIAEKIKDREERVESKIHIAKNYSDISFEDEAEMICQDIYQDAYDLAEENNVIPLTSIAEILAETGSVQKSIRISEKVKKFIDNISNENERCWSLGKIAIVYINLKEIENAIEIAESICSEFEGNLPLGEIMISLSKEDEIGKALDLRSCISNNELLDSILSDIGSRLAKRGRIEEAEYVKGLIENIEEKEWVMKDIAIFKSSEGEIIKSIDIAEGLIDTDIKILTMTEIAKSLIDMGKENKLRGLVEFILELSEESISCSVEVNVIEVLADMGFLDLAIDRARKIEMLEEKAIALSYISAKSTGIPVLSQDFLSTLESIKEKEIIDDKIKNDIKNIAIKLSENKNRNEIVNSIDALHDRVDRKDR